MEDDYALGWEKKSHGKSGEKREEQGGEWGGGASDTGEQLSCMV